MATRIVCRCLENERRCSASRLFRNPPLLSVTACKVESDLHRQGNNTCLHLAWHEGQLFATAIRFAGNTIKCRGHSLTGELVPASLTTRWTITYRFEWRDCAKSSYVNA